VFTRSAACKEAVNITHLVTVRLGANVKWSCPSAYAPCNEDTWGSGSKAPHFLTSALNGKEWTALHLWKQPPVSIWYNTGWANQPRCSGKEKISASTGNQIPVTHPRVSHFTELSWLIKSKAILVLKQYAMKTHGKMEVKFHTFLTLALEGGEWSASHSSHFTPGETAHSTNVTVG
jgi:hypothetical protein